MTDLERVARAILKRRGEPDWLGYAAAIDRDRELALAALTALREPSPAMVEAGTVAILKRFAGGSSGLDDMAESIAEDHFRAGWRAAIDVALNEKKRP